MQDAIRAVKGAWCRQFCCHGIVLSLLALSVITAAAAAGPGSDAPPTIATQLGPFTYVPGRGAHLGTTGFALGGYANVNLVRDDGRAARLTLDDLSFFLTWDPTPHLHLFAELELEDLVQVDDQGRGGTNSAQSIAERLYGDFALSDSFAVRFGKFLTPLGRWNLIHAQPLVWTTSRPLVTELPFDTHTTGAMVFGSLFPITGALTYSLYGQFLDDLDRSEPANPNPVKDSGGGRLEYAAAGGWSVGVSYLAFTRQGRWHYLGGADALWRRGPFELMGEAADQESADGGDSERGLYLQGVVEVLPRIYLVGRYEYYDQRSPAPTVNIGVTGLAWKPLPYLMLKAEYLFSDHRAEDSPPGFKSSIAILF